MEMFGVMWYNSFIKYDFRGDGMKKKMLLIGLIVIAGVIGVLICCAYSLPDGKTIESREEILDNAISKGGSWSIAKEIEIDGYIISAAYSTDNKSTIAVFKPESNGRYKFSTSTNRTSDEIIVGGAIINGAWYDLIWFNGAQTEYAEIIYTINGKESKPLRYDTTDMDVIYNKITEKDYSMEVYYYDSEGNRYE